jgi:hypothetical protein
VLLASESRSDRRFWGFLWPNFAENGVWGQMGAASGTHANTEMRFYNLS